MLIVKIKSEPYPREYKHFELCSTDDAILICKHNLINDILYLNEIEYIRGETNHVNEKW